ncbi:MAG: FAD-dependent oxidoreductase [Oscillospiraceae bacterium]|jgi:2,4-dienoyl-CoA reductase-like NADH-dependent reductase (Old Yellow Enzyme family)/thioredoxin reductase
MQRKFPLLFSPLKVGKLTLRNRIEASATSIHEFDSRDFPTKESIAYYQEKAAGGAAIVTIGETPVHTATGRSHDHAIALDNPDILPVLADLADAIHQHGAFASLQIAHGGGFCRPAFINGRNPIGPSAMKNPMGDDIEPMDEDMIEFITECFGEAALRLKQASFDMCQVHAGHGWLLGQFLSPLTNKRTDRFGGSPENRARFPLMVIDRIRQKCGEFPIELRISGTEDFEGGYTLEDGIEYAKMFDGKVDLFNVSIGTVFNAAGRTTASPGPHNPPGMNVYLAAEFKKHVKTPVAALGGINTPELMEDILASGKADVVNIGRALIADPYLPKKASLGRGDEIRPCLRCLNCMDSGLKPTHKLRCAVNPLIRRELDFRFCNEPKVKKNILVVGGGPGGMQAAITAAERGHNVTLCEKSSSLGGLLRHAEHVPFKADMKRYLDWLIRMTRKSGAEILLGIKADSEFIKSCSADAVIAAVGAQQSFPSIPGIDGPNVVASTRIYDDGVEIGKNVVIIGAGAVGCETAIHMVMLGKKPVLIEVADDILPDAGISQRIYTQNAMKKYGIIPNLGLRCSNIDKNGVAAVNKEGTELFFPADTVIIATGLKPLEAVREDLRKEALEFIAIGDCLRPGRIMNATADGYCAAMNL